MSPTSARWTALTGVLALLVIGAVVYFVATSAPPAPRDPALASSTPAPPVPGRGPVSAPAEPEADPMPDVEPAPEVEPAGQPERYAYQKSHRWGPEMVAPPELTAHEQVLVDVACNFTAAQYDFDPTKVHDYGQILQRFEPFAEPSLFAQISTDVTEFGSIGDYELWVREGATVSVECAGAPIAPEPVPVTTLGGLEVDAWAVYTRTGVRMDLPDANPEQSYPTFVVYVAQVPGVADPRVVQVEVQGGAH